MVLKKCRRDARRGFTLMEMLVVVAIIALLAAFVVPRMLGYLGSSEVKIAATQISSLEGSLQQYSFAMGGFPNTEQGLGALVRAPQSQDSSGVSSWDGPYVEKGRLPKDPWGNEYQYVFPPEKGTSDYPDIWSYGPDKEDGTEDDICSWDKESEGEEGFDGGMDGGPMDDGPGLDAMIDGPTMD